MYDFLRGILFTRIRRRFLYKEHDGSLMTAALICCVLEQDTLFALRQSIQPRMRREFPFKECLLSAMISPEKISLKNQRIIFYYDSAHHIPVFALL